MMVAAFFTTLAAYYTTFEAGSTKLETSLLLKFGRSGNDDRTEYPTVNAMSAFWDAYEDVFVFGTRTPASPYYSDEAFLFSTTTNTVEAISHLPSASSENSAVFDLPPNSTMYIFRGGPPTRTDILKFDSSSGRVDVLNVSLPRPTIDSCSIWTGSKSYIIEGRNFGYNDPAPYQAVEDLHSRVGRA